MLSTLVWAKFKTLYLLSEALVTFFLLAFISGSILANFWDAFSSVGADFTADAFALVKIAEGEAFGLGAGFRVFLLEEGVVEGVLIL